MSAEIRNPNLLQLAAASKLEPLLDKLVFVGGCATGLLVSDPAAAPVRPSLDVDAIVEVASYAEFTVFEQQRDLGFHESHTEGAPICRWVSEKLLLDVMPVDSSILGFSNRWYGPAFKHAQQLTVGPHEIRLITAPYFLATKLEAFRGRGRKDYRMSHDLEDIVTVIDGRPEIVDEVREAEAGLRKLLSDELSVLLADRDFIEALPGHLLPDTTSQQRLGIILDRIKQFTP